MSAKGNLKHGHLASSVQKITQSGDFFPENFARIKRYPQYCSRKRTIAYQQTMSNPHHPPQGQSPKVSVCIAMYNASRFLRECMDSILAQTFTDFELLIVDDGSTDDSCRIVESYEDPRIRLIRNKHDYIGSLNLLLDEAAGEYIARMDADDTMRTERLAIQCAHMDKHPEVDILGAGIHCFGQLSDECPPSCIGEFGSMELMEACCFFHPTVMMRTSSVRRHDLRYREAYIYAEDYALWMEASQKGLLLKNIPDIVVNYRVSPGQLSQVRREAQCEHSILAKRQLITSWFDRVETYLDEPAHARPARTPITAIIPFYNEGEELGNTVHSIRETAGDSIDILVVNDRSDDGIDYKEMLAPYDVEMITNPFRMGPAMSKEKGVQYCVSPYFILLDAHMRFYQQNWVERILEELAQDDQQILCCQTRVLRKKDGQVTVEKADTTYGAFMYWGNEAYKPMSRWNPNPSIKALQSQHIPCVLGASYVSSKRYWNKLLGFKGLMCYGCEEPFISMKAWMEGGKCRFIDDVVIGHIYKDHSNISVMNAKYTYNFLLMADLLLPTSSVCQTMAGLQAGDAGCYATAKLILDTTEAYRESLRARLKDTLTANDFDYIRQINYVIHPGAEVNLAKMVAALPEVLAFCEAQNVTAHGLYEGHAGLIVFYLLYHKITHERKWKARGRYLLDVITRWLVESREVKYSFAEGVCGIGWALLYLADNGLVSLSDVSPAIAQIDKHIHTLAPCRFTDTSLSHGVTGIIAYYTARLFIVSKGLAMKAPTPDFIQEARNASRSYLKTHPCTKSNQKEYSLHLLMSRYHGGEGWSMTRLDFSDIMDLPTAIPENQKHWHLNLKSGCLGYAINLLITQWKVNENK